MFDHLIVSSETPQSRSPRVLVVSLVLHGFVLALVVAAPLLSYEELPGSELLTRLLPPEPPDVLPPPVPPPDPPPSREIIAAVPQPVVRLPPMMPPPASVIPAAPDTDLSASDAPLLTDVFGAAAHRPSTAGLVGLPVAWSAGDRPEPPPPPVVTRKEPRHVSSGIQSARLIRKVEPVYPPLAKAARISGIVTLRLWIDEEGNVTSVSVLNGHSLLREAAETAVRQWKYSPTILNGEPWPVLATVTVRFVLR